MSETGRQILKTVCPLDCPDTGSILVTVEKGSGINTLVPNRLTDLGGGSTLRCNLVEVQKQ